MSIQLPERAAEFRRTGDSPGMLKSEKQMSEGVARFFGNAALEIKVGHCIFDVVSYDKRKKLFRVVECKKTTRITGIGKTFGQVSAYSSVVAERAFKFVDALSRKLQMRFGRWMEATENGRQIRVEFYVALTHDACKEVALLKTMKQSYPQVRIIRVKQDESVRGYIRYKGKKIHELAKARPTVIKIEQPAPADTAI